ncbi:MAG: nitroreductase family protein [Candidatus Roizmanbacteria bacterium]
MNNKQMLEIKKIATDKPLIPVILERFSPRHYSSEKIPENDLQIIFEASRWTPSAKNIQPWYFYWTEKGSETFDKLGTALFDFNYWAKEAPVMIVVCVNKPDLSEDNQWHNYMHFDVGQAVAYLTLQAQSMGYYSRQMAGVDTVKAHELLSINADHEVFVVIALGKLGNYEDLKDEMILEKEKMPRVRKDNIASKI